VAVRPSGTEPKVKFYIFTFVPAELLHDLAVTKEELDDRVRRIGAELMGYANAI
jgi:phosphoglucomutase/phosphomannomutase